MNVIIEHPDALDRVRGMSEERKNHILEVLQNKDESQAALRFLMENGLTLKLASKVIAVYPKNALEVVQENPYTLVETVEGIGFKRQMIWRCTWRSLRIIRIAWTPA